MGPRINLHILDKLLYLSKLLTHTQWKFTIVNTMYCWYSSAHIIPVWNCWIIYFWFSFFLSLILSITLQDLISSDWNNWHCQYRVWPPFARVLNISLEVALAFSSRSLWCENSIWPCWRRDVTLPQGLLRSATLPVA
jgi:hypothetical protein